MTSENNQMKTYVIPVTWSVSNDITVEAASLTEAAEIARRLDLPEEGAEYVDGSFEVNLDQYEEE